MNALYLQSSRYILLAFIAFGMATVLTLLMRKVIRYVIDKRWEEGREDVTRLKFFGNSISAIFYGLAMAYIFYEVPLLNNLGTAMFAGAGVLAAVIGFASQKAFSNIISGIFILLFRPFKVGDLVTVGSRSGMIEDITLRHTVIRDYENRRVIMPNSAISDETIVNSSIVDEKIRQQVFFGISYESNLDLAIKIIQEEAMAHPFSFDARTSEDIADGDPEVVVRVIEWQDSGISLRAQVWTAGLENGFVLKCDLLHSVKSRFDQEGNEIPYPHRTLVMKSGADTFKPDGSKQTQPSP